MNENDDVDGFISYLHNTIAIVVTKWRVMTQFKSNFIWSLGYDEFGSHLITSCTVVFIVI